MSALTGERRLNVTKMQHKSFPVAANVKCWKGGAGVFDTATGFIKPAVTATGLKITGLFDETIDNTGGAAGAVVVSVDLMREVKLTYFVNDSTVLAADFGQTVYFNDDQTVSLVSTGKSIAGICWDVDAVKGVGVELGIVAP